MARGAESRAGRAHRRGASRADGAVRLRAGGLLSDGDDPRGEPGRRADLARLRCAFLREIGQVLPETFEANLRARFGASFSDATTLSWIAEDAGAIVGTISANPWRQLPTARNPDGTVWYVLNVYVVPSHRRRGLSRRLLETLIAAARDAGVRELNLHATSAGRPVYASLGFVSAEDIMELRLG